MFESLLPPVLPLLLLMGACVLAYLLIDDLRLRNIVSQQQVVIATQQREVEFLRETLTQYFKKEAQAEQDRERKELLSAVIQALQNPPPISTPHSQVSISGNATVAARDLVGGNKTTGDGKT